MCLHSRMMSGMLMCPDCGRSVAEQAFYAFRNSPQYRPYSNSWNQSWGETKVEEPMGPDMFTSPVQVKNTDPLPVCRMERQQQPLSACLTQDDSAMKIAINTLIWDWGREDMTLKQADELACEIFEKLRGVSE